MNRLQESYRSMYLVVERFIEASDPTVLALMPNFDSEFQEFKTAMLAINAASEQQIYNRTGIRAEKQQYQIELADLCVTLSAKVRAYAHDIGDINLFRRFDRQRSLILNLNDTLCRDYCQQVHDETLVLLPLLSTYLITTNELEDLQKAIDKFWEWVSKPRNSISERRVSTTNLAEAFEVCANKISGMDIHLRMLETSHPELYLNYVYRRKLVSPGYRKLSLRGIVQGSLGELLSGVTVKISTLNVETITTDKGYFEFKNLPPGVYMATYDLEGYETQSQPVAIVANERRDVTIVLTEENSGRIAS